MEKIQTGIEGLPLTHTLKVSKDTYDQVFQNLAVYVNRRRFGKRINPDELLGYFFMYVLGEEHIPKIWKAALLWRGTWDKYEKRFNEVWPSHP